MRAIPIPAAVVSALRSYKARRNEERLRLGLQDNGLVFATEDGKPIDPPNFTRHWEYLLKKPGFRESGSTTRGTPSRP